MFIEAVVMGVIAGLLCSVLGRHAGTTWAVLCGAAWILGVFYLEVITDDIALDVAGAALVAFATAKVGHDVTGFLERPEVRTARASG